MSEQVLTDFEVVQILNTDRPKTGWAYGLCREVEAKVVSRCRAQGGNTSDESVELIDSYLEAQGITQAAANKAAEEGGLPALPEMPHAVATCKPFGPVFDRLAVQMYAVAYADLAIAADRASRQVANKAEVEGIASSEIPEGWPTEIWLNAGDEKLAPFAEYDELSWCSLPQGENDIRYVREDLLATPPATTGASTVLTDERIVAIAHERDCLATAIADAAVKAGVCRANASLTGPLLIQLCDDMALVAAQAGQVAEKDRLLKALERAAIAESALRRLADEVENDAVPGWEDRLTACIAEANSILNGSVAGQVAVPTQEQIEWSHDIQKRLIEAVQDEGDDEGDRQVMAEAACLLAALTGRAPSPVKESK